MQHAASLQRDLVQAVEDLSASRQHGVELSDENKHLLDETKQVSYSRPPLVSYWWGGDGLGTYAESRSGEGVGTICWFVVVT